MLRWIKQRRINRIASQSLVHSYKMVRREYKPSQLIGYVIPTINGDVRMPTNRELLDISVSKGMDADSVYQRQYLLDTGHTSLYDSMVELYFDSDHL